jgi:hypothetical protein
MTSRDPKMATTKPLIHQSPDQVASTVDPATVNLTSEPGLTSSTSSSISSCQSSVYLPFRSDEEQLASNRSTPSLSESVASYGDTATSEEEELHGTQYGQTTSGKNNECIVH